MHINNKHGDKTQQQASTRYVLMTGTTPAIDSCAARSPPDLLQGGVAQLAQLTSLSRTAALLAILEAALKQMHVCTLLHNSDVDHLSHSPACFFLLAAPPSL
jgi:hypothetical protein